LGLLGKGAHLGYELLRARLDLREAAVVETRADVPAIVELSVLPIAEEERAERRSRALAARITPDHELGALHRLDLEPRLRALARLVAAVQALGDDALEAARERGPVQLLAVLLGVHQLHVGRGQQALLEPAPAVRVGRSTQVQAREMQQVEAEEDG